MAKTYYERLVQAPKIYLSVKDFLEQAAEYFEWVDEHPLLEEQIFQFQGAIVRADKAKMRPYTKTGLAGHIGMTTGRMNNLRNRSDEWAEAVTRVEEVIYTQKFDGAAAGLLNAGIISRDLGLTDKTETTLAGAGADAPPITFTIAPLKSGTFLPPETVGTETAA